MGLAAHLVPYQVTVCEIERRRQLHANMVLHVKKMDDHFARNLESLELKDLYMHLIIRRAIRYQEDWVGWCDEVLDAIGSSVHSSDRT
jgi:hypothetical protein